MSTEEENRLTMYRTVGRFFTGPGAPLVAIKLIQQKNGQLTTVVETIERLMQQQQQQTRGVTETRDTLKRSVVDAADGLRLLVRAVTPDSQLKGELKTPLSKMVKGDDAAYVKYLKKITDSIGLQQPEALENAGYEATLLPVVTTAIAQLAGTEGATRDIEIKTSTATDSLETWFKKATQVLEAEDGLDALVHAQKAHPTRGELVPQYDEARQIIGTAAARRRPVYKGRTRYGSPLLVYDRMTTPAPSFTLGNRSGKGISLLYYTATDPTAKPAPGQGVLVKNREVHHLANYDGLGPADGRYLLVLQLEMAGEGQYYVQG